MLASPHGALYQGLLPLKLAYPAFLWEADSGPVSWEEPLLEDIIRSGRLDLGAQIGGTVMDKSHVPSSSVCDISS